MKILAFADTHGKEKFIERLLEKGKRVDILVCAGDITFFGNGLKKIIEKFAKLKKTMLIIHGNHESEESIRELSKRFSWLIFIHKGSYKFGNYHFFGYGGDGFATQDSRYENIIKQFKKTVKKGEKVVIVTHGPPYGTKCDELPYQGHVGCKTYTKIDKQIKPILHICGHLHETASRRDRIGDTLVINPGGAGKIIRI